MCFKESLEAFFKVNTSDTKGVCSLSMPLPHLVAGRGISTGVKTGTILIVFHVNGTELFT